MPKYQHRDEPEREREISLGGEAGRRLAGHGVLGPEVGETSRSGCESGQASGIEARRELAHDLRRRLGVR